MRAGSEQLRKVLAGSHTSYLVVDVLHGTDRVEQGVVPVSWDLSSDIGENVVTDGRLRFVHSSRNGESWVPDGAKGLLSPFRATLLLTLVVGAGEFEERVQLGLFDVVDVPFAEDTVSHVDARWFQEDDEVGDVFPEPDLFPGDDEWPGDVEYGFGGLTGSLQRVVTSTVEVRVASLDNRVLQDSLDAPLTVRDSALDVWRRHGVLPVRVASDVSLPVTTFPAESGSRLDLVRTCASYLGGSPLVDSNGYWVVADGSNTTVLQAWGDQSTVLEILHEVSTVGFSNVVVGSYEAEDGTPLNAVWIAKGDLSPEALGGRRWVSYHKSDMVRTQRSADAAVEAVGLSRSSREVDIPVVCVTNPLLEVGDRVRIEGWVRPLEGVAQKIEMTGGATMTVTVQVRRSFSGSE